MAGPADEPQVVAPQTGAVPLEQAPAEAAPVVAAESAPAEQPVVAAETAAAEAPAAEKAATVAETASLLESATLEEPKPEGDKKPAEAAPAEVKAEEKAADAPKEGDQPKTADGDKKPVEAAKEGDQPKPEEKPAEPPKLEPVEYKFELPEGFNLADDLKTQFTGVLDGFRQDPSNVQPLVDFHVAEVNRIVEKIGDDQHRVFNDTRREWQKQIKGDEEFGGAGFETSSKAVARMRDLLVSSHKPGTPEYDRQAKEANEFFRITGAGDHPVLWRILHNAARYLDEAPLPPANIGPAPGGRAPNGSKRSMLYDNPTSPNNRS